MDMETEQAVWRRVKAPGDLTAEEALLPERLEALILEQLAQASTLRALSGRISGPGRSELSRMAARTEAGAKELTALHYLLTGRKLRLKPPKPAAPLPVPEALRKLCLQMRETARSYESLQAEFGRWNAELGRGADRTRADSRRLMELLQRQLERGQ